MRTDGTFVTKRMETIQRVGVVLFVAPDQINPSWQVLADIAAFQSLAPSLFQYGKGNCMREILLSGWSRRRGAGPPSPTEEA
jgi:hypothetical protein